MYLDSPKAQVTGGEDRTARGSPQFRKSLAIPHVIPSKAHLSGPMECGKR